jgi:deoxyribose-phosphate aldolase
MNLAEKYNLKADIEKINRSVRTIMAKKSVSKDIELDQKIFSLIDLTSLDVSDSEETITSMISRVNNFGDHFGQWPNVAAICVYPVFVPLMNSELKDHNVKKATVSGNFPSSQSFPEIKLKEAEAALSAGADELDIVLPLGKFFEGKYDEIKDEIESIKRISGDRHLKVIIESGIIKDLGKIKEASFLCMDAGADFIKTSTGKNGPGADLHAVYAMCEAIQEYNEQTGKTVGIKPAGGISDAETARRYYYLVEELLGEKWLNPELFRIGASRLANSLLGKNYF